jgi:hypothetical protein
VKAKGRAKSVWENLIISRNTLTLPKREDTCLGAEVEVIVISVLW